MKYKLFNMLFFTSGIAIGSLVTWRILKAKYDSEYEQKYQEEVQEAKEFYKKKFTKSEIITASQDKPDIMEYAAKIRELGYEGKEVPVAEKHTIRKEEDSMRDEPYVISEEEFDEAGYDTETLTYFVDGVLTDWYNEKVDDPDELVGRGTLENFDEHAGDGDIVYVRNDQHMTDYEIQRDHRHYKDVYSESDDDQ